MIKVIASDMDGTLLNSKHRISKKTIKAIKEAQKAGIHFVISTGRDYEGVEFLLKENDISCECVLMNGSEFRDKDGNIIEKINIEKSKVIEIIDIIQSKGMVAEIFTNKGRYSNLSPDRVLKDFISRVKFFDKINILKEAINAAKNHHHFKSIKYIEDINEFLDSDIEIRKIITFYDDIEVVDKAKEELEKISGLAVSSSFRQNIEITDISAQKGIILGKVVDKMGIDRDSVAVVGDSFNDYSMFTEFKNSYAMENAIPEIKEIAKNITATNDNDGVAKVIYEALNG